MVVFVAWVLQGINFFAPVLLFGVLIYAAVPVVIFFAVVGWKNGTGGFQPGL